MSEPVGRASGHGNPIEVALHGLAGEGVNVAGWAWRNVIRNDEPRSRQFQDLLLRRKPMENTFRHQMARGQRKEVRLSHVIADQSLHKYVLPVAGLATFRPRVASEADARHPSEK